MDKHRIPAEEAIYLIKAAGGLSSLAHPGLVETDTARGLEDLIKVLVSMGLRGIEVYYPGHTPWQTRYFESLTKKYNLLPTGGTDFHGEINPQIQMGCGLGNLKIPLAVFERIQQETGSF